MRETAVTVFVRHSADCKHASKGEFYAGCNCRKHLRWTSEHQQYRKAAGTRSWQRALEVKRETEAKVNGTAMPTKPRNRDRLRNRQADVLSLVELLTVTDPDHALFALE